MAITLTVNGTSYSFPTSGENPGWGSQVTSWAQAVSQATLQKSGGSFTLTADVDFGANYGLKLAVLKSRTSNAAQSGLIRLANSDEIKFRNSTNTADIALGVGSTDTVPAYAGKDLVNVDAAQTLYNKTLDGATTSLSNVPWTSIDKTGSNLTDLATRNHNDLQNPNGGTSGQYYHLTQEQHTSLTSIGTDGKDPTGWVDPENIDVAYDSAARTVTLTHSSGTLEYYYRGVKKSKTSPWTTTTPHTNTTGNTYFFYIDGNGDSQFTTNSFPGFDQVLVAYVYFGSSTKFAIREVHGLMPWQAHEEFHNTIGTYRYSGGLVTAGSYTKDTNTVDAVTPAVDSAVIADEDLFTTIPAFTNGSGYTRVHFDSGLAVFNTASTFPYPTDGTDIQYNQNPSSGTALTSMTVSNRWVNVYGVFAPVTSDATSQAYRIIWITGQQIYTTQAAALAEDFRTLTLGNLSSIFSELVPYIRLTYKRVISNLTANAQINADPTYLLGNKLSLVSVSGVAPTDHQGLTGRSSADAHPRTALTDGTAYRIVANNSTGAMSENAALTAAHVIYADTNGQLAGEAALSAARGGTGVSNNAAATTTRVGNYAKTETLTNTTSVTYPTSGTLATLAGAEALTNKDIDGGTASDTSRITVPKAAKTTLDGLTRKEGTIVYGSDTDKLYVDDGSSLKAVGSGGAGSGETNYVTNPSGVDDNAAATPTGWATSDAAKITVTTTKTAAELPRENITKSGIKILSVASAVSTSAGAYWDFTLDDVDSAGRIMKIKWDQKLVGAYTAGHLEVVITDQNATWGSRTVLATPFTTAIPASDGTFQTYFLAPSTQACSLVIRATADMADNVGIVISDVVVGPNVQVQGAAIGAWKSWTPTGSWSTNTTYTGRYREVGDSIECSVFISLAGVPTSANLTVNLPSGYTVNTTAMSSSATGAPNIVGYGDMLDSGTANYPLGVGYASTTSVGVFYTDDATGGVVYAGSVAQNAPVSTPASGDTVTIRFTLPVNELSSNVTLVPVKIPNTPTVQKFTTGSGTYTTPPGVLYLRVRMVGGGAGGGGGGGSGSNTSSVAGSAGSNSTFGTSLLIAGGGSVSGQDGGGGSSGGTATVNSPAIEVLTVTGRPGEVWSFYGTAGTAVRGQNGSSSLFSGYGEGGIAVAGKSASANSGAGGGGGGISSGSYFGGAGGSAGGYIEAIIYNPLASYSYTVGSGGSGGPGVASGFAGGAGGSGYIEVTEYYYPNASVPVSSMYVVGRTDGVAPATGMVGEQLTASGSSVATNTSGQTTIATLTLTTGTWDVNCQSYGDNAVTQTGMYSFLWIKGSNSNTSGYDRMASSCPAGQDTCSTFAGIRVNVASGDADKTIILKQQSKTAAGLGFGSIRATRIA